MPRANRFYLPGQIWHITHRCHRQQFLLKFLRDRRLWHRWLFEARKRYGLCVLDYIGTSNHIHLLVRDHGEGEIARSMQLVSGRVAQAYNQRKRRKGAFWEDRYHATAIESGEHLARCLVYIDLNMVRAGAVTHPAAWPVSGYREIQSQPKRYRIIDTPALHEALGLNGNSELSHIHREWVEQALKEAKLQRDTRWSQTVAVGSQTFVEGVQEQLGSRAQARQVEDAGDATCLRESPAAYIANLGPENVALTPN
ncbi:MAG: transposase [Guyparkeria sp.]|uniref:transposase n=1 Tax=Guyparkeria sp. TaxID=2035736 RepID=UPI00397DAAF6